MAQNNNTLQTGVVNRLASVSVKTYVIWALVLFVGFGFYWWRAVYSDPQNAFEGMLNNSLRLNGVSKTVSQDEDGQSTKQTSRLNVTDQPAVLSETVLKQGTGTTVNTESIGTPTADFVRYTKIVTDQKGASGNDLDFSSIINQWGSDELEPSDGLTDGQLYNEIAIGIIPFGNLTAAQRHELLHFIEDEKVYEVDYDTVTKGLQNGRPRYTYTVGVDAEAYVKMIQKFGHMVGLNNLDELDASQYAGSARLEFEVTVDVWSRELTEVKSPGSDRAEVYSGHNASQPVDLPEDPITVEELQTRLQSIQ